MLNSIGANYFVQQYQTAQFTRRGNESAENSQSQNSPSATVEISDAGLNALANANDESKLSDKAKNYLETLRKKYGDYDFSVSNNPDTSKTVSSSKEYSVIFSTDELEKMADDEEYAQKVMGQVGSAVDMLKGLSEKDLGEGVQFAQLSVSIDDEGNMKLFAQLEKLSADQKERLDAAKERRDNPDNADNAGELTKIIFKPFDIEASSEEDFLNRVFGIDWSKVPDEEVYI